MEPGTDHRRRAVITGFGAVSPIGLTAADFWAALLAGRSGVRRITDFEVADLPTQIAAQVWDFDPGRYIGRKVYRRIDPFAQYAIAAAGEAVEHAKLTITEELAPRVGVLIGSGYGASKIQQGITLQLASGGDVRKVGAYSSASSAIDNAAAEVALLLGAQGPSGAVSTACASGTSSVGDALRLIRHGYADVVVAGGADDSVTRPDIASACAARALSRRNDEPERASRPFDRDRDGFVVAAGAGVVVVEEAEHAIRRGAEILAEVAGYGATTDAYHATAPHPDGLGARRAMRMALADARLAADEVDHVNAHGTSTLLNDKIESMVIRAVLGDHAPRVPISAIKSMTGHVIGAAGTLELIATIQAVRTGVVPPTINCDDPEDPGLNYVPHQPQEHQVRVALSNSFGFGGHNAVLAVRQWRP
jgi:3-oxoacyl-[acyl-carrier-protein] synthase II